MRNHFKAALLMPANWLALLAAGIASVAMGDWLPITAAGGAVALCGVLLSTMQSFRSMVRVQAAQLVDVALPPTFETLLAPSQQQHYQELEELKERILASYRKMPGGRVLVASSQPTFEGLLASFLRLVTTLNNYKHFLSAPDKDAIEKELMQLESEITNESNERLRDIKLHRTGILKKRVQRFKQAEENREIVSYQLAGIEDVLRLTHEQSINNPEQVSRQLEALTAQVATTEATVRELEQFSLTTEELFPPMSVSDQIR